MTEPLARPLIVADIGGTNARFAITSGAGAPLSAAKSYRGEAFASFEAALGAYLEEAGPATPKAISIGAAGPVSHGRVMLTNSPWVIDPAKLRLDFGLDTAYLANDLVAMAAGIALAPAQAFLDLPGGHSNALNRTLIIAIGTGLGVAWCERDGNVYRIHASEGGHMAFAPTTDIEMHFSKAAIERGEIVTFEHLISGSGIKFVYNRLRGGEPELDSSEAILLAAESKTNRAADATLALMVSALCTFARNLIAVLGGVDGIVFAGGLGRRLRSHLSSSFLARLRSGREVPLDLSAIGVRVALDDTLPLTGAANLAYGLAKIAGPPTDSSS
jgi:glucokinase